MSHNLSERLLLLWACIVRRVPSTAWITSDLLLQMIERDQSLVQAKAPQYYYCYDQMIGYEYEIAAVVENGLIEESANRSSTPKYRRTPLGDVFLKSIEPRLSDALDQMPMTDEGLLDFLGLL